MILQLAKTRDALFVEGVGERNMFSEADFDLSLAGAFLTVIHRGTKSVCVTPIANLAWGHPKLAPALSLDAPPPTAAVEEKAAEAPPRVARKRAGT